LFLYGREREGITLVSSLDGPGPNTGPTTDTCF
jgi:hypothetical protein